MGDYIDDTYVANAVGGSAIVDALTGSSSSVLAQHIAAAEGIIKGALENSGYATTFAVGSAALAVVQSACIGALVHKLYNLKQQEVPAAYAIDVGTFNAIVAGELKIPGVQPSAVTGVGGVEFSDSSDTSDDGRPAVFKNLRDIY